MDSLVIGMIDFHKEKAEKVMEALHEIDEVAYVRFASVYRQFRDITDFMKEVGNLLKQHPKENEK